MDELEWLAERFEERRTRLRAVAYRILGSLTEADDAVQEAWLRLSRAESSQVENLTAWLTTIVARVALNMVRSRQARHEELLGPHVPDPIIDLADGTNPEHEAVLADAVGLALQIVLQRLSPSERLAYVLHDMFDMPFDEIAPIVDCSAQAARQLASRARRRIRGAESRPDSDRRARRAVVDAYVAAARDGNFDALIALLHPNVVLRSDRGPKPEGASVEVRGAKDVADRAITFSRLGLEYKPALINGTPGLVCVRNGQPFSVMGFMIAAGKITEMNILADPDRLKRLDLTAFVERDDTRREQNA
ncbi:MAG: sigma-70 family RNA polymerase sigma factor [Acidobacteriaceae bacterium]|nr:sigma-70 family RNA polymerase sigma factor [Acidobacteriaceae bacterium]